MKSSATIFAAVASMALVSACATANGQTSDDSASAPQLAEAPEAEKKRHMRIHMRRGADAESILGTYDKDEDGRISLEEYNNRPNRDRFAALDANDDGFVDLAELKSDREERMAARMEEKGERMAERMERHAERMERMAERALRQAERQIERMDRNEDGEINQEDFEFDFEFDFDEEAFAEKMEGLGERMKARMAKHRERTLKKMDSNGDGVVSREEFTARHDEHFNKMDKDGNGSLSADELDGMMRMRGMMSGMPGMRGMHMGKRHKGPGQYEIIIRDKDDDDEDENGDAGE